MISIPKCYAKGNNILNTLKLRALVHFILFISCLIKTLNTPGGFPIDDRNCLALDRVKGLMGTLLLFKFGLLRIIEVLLYWLSNIIALLFLGIKNLRLMQLKLHGTLS